MVAGQVQPAASSQSYLPLGNCLHEVDQAFPAGAIRHGIATAVNASQFQPYLGDLRSTNTLDYSELGATLANLSAALNWEAVQPQMLQVASQLEDDLSSVMGVIGTLVQSINLTQAGDVLKAAQSPTDETDVKALLYQLAATIDTATFAATIKNLTAALDLSSFGADLDGIKGNLNLQLLGDVVAALPSAINFDHVGSLLSSMGSLLSFQTVGAGISELALRYAGAVSQECATPGAQTAG